MNTVDWKKAIDLAKNAKDCQVFKFEATMHLCYDDFRRPYFLVVAPDMINKHYYVTEEFNRNVCIDDKHLTFYAEIVEDEMTFHYDIKVPLPCPS